MNFPEEEEKILKFWKDNNIFQKLREKNKGKAPWSFLDGPITANNSMGVHHAWGRTYKDLFQRYKAMKGFDERYQNGFDCQGLWVEVEVEKELGFKSKKDIEDFGIDKFVSLCKERVKKYSEIQTNQSIRLGQWMDWDNSYYTMSDDNNYAIWGFLKKCHKSNLLYKGKDVVPWCKRCGTAISQHEILTEEYKEITHKSVFVKLEILKREKSFFLAWTTTPWTLPANVALAVHPDLTYVEVKNKENETFILLKSKAFFIKEGEIVKEFLGKELENLKYKGMFDELPAVKKKNHQIILWKEVTEEEGTGIVHIAPGCGQEDFKLSKEVNLPVIDPTSEESRYKEGFGFLEGKLVTDVNDLIFENLKEKNIVYKIEDYTHRYPTCWRCKSELIFRLVNEWYISMEKLRDRLIEISKKINWIPSFGLEREIDWLQNMQDWLISKKRYWGLALPIFECDKCGNIEVIGSKEELEERAVEGLEQFKGKSPHRPFVDEIKIRCDCGNLVSRIKDVGNPWLDAGIVPFSTMEYFSNKDFWKKWFPADLICESFPGQFKNWFYSIIVMSAVLEDKEPVKTIFGYATVRDEKGEEMHKSKGNAIWFDDAVNKIGADPMRFMYCKQNPANNLRFGYSGAEEVKKKLLTFLNTLVFFETYVSKEEFPSKDKISSENILDKWIISKLNGLILSVEESLEKYDAALATISIENFFINDLSLWYVRRSRKRFHKESKEREKAIETFYYVLLNLLKIMAPIIPFFTEKAYSEIKKEEMPESIHLCDWPEAKNDLIDKDLEEKMEEARNIVNIALSKRAEKGIKVRQPLEELRFKSPKIENEKSILEIIKEEVNVKKIIHDNNIENVELNTNIPEYLKEEGTLREIIRNIQVLRKKSGLKPKDKISILFDGSKEIEALINKNKKTILEETISKDIKKEKGSEIVAEKEIKIEKESVWVGILVNI